LQCQVFRLDQQAGLVELGQQLANRRVIDHPELIPKSVGDRLDRVCPVE